MTKWLDLKLRLMEANYDRFPAVVYGHHPENKKFSIAMGSMDLEDSIPQEQGVAEAEYHGRDVALGKPMAGDVKKSKVYVYNEKGNVVKVNFGDPNMRIKKSNPARRKSFRARHNCENPGPRWKARYWSCKAW